MPQPSLLFFLEYFQLGLGCPFVIVHAVVANFPERIVLTLHYFYLNQVLIGPLETKRRKASSSAVVNVANNNPSGYSYYFPIQFSFFLTGHALFFEAYQIHWQDRELSFLCSFKGSWQQVSPKLWHELLIKDLTVYENFGEIYNHVMTSYRLHRPSLEWWGHYDGFRLRFWTEADPFPCLRITSHTMASWSLELCAKKSRHLPPITISLKPELKIGEETYSEDKRFLAAFNDVFDRYTKDPPLF